jgi:hypothetical protein
MRSAFDKSFFFRNMRSGDAHAISYCASRNYIFFSFIFSSIKQKALMLLQLFNCTSLSLSLSNYLSLYLFFSKPVERCNKCVHSIYIYLFTYINRYMHTYLHPYMHTFTKFYFFCFQFVSIQ